MSRIIKRLRDQRFSMCPRMTTATSASLSGLPSPLARLPNRISLRYLRPNLSRSLRSSSSNSKRTTGSSITVRIASLGFVSAIEAYLAR